MSKQPDIFDIGKFDREDAASIKAVARGEANEYEQQRAIKLIVDRLSRANDLPYSPNKPDETAFFNGRAFVGKRLLWLINAPMETIIGKEKNNGSQQSQSERPKPKSKSRS